MRKYYTCHRNLNIIDQAPSHGMLYVVIMVGDLMQLSMGQTCLSMELN